MEINTIFIKPENRDRFVKTLGLCVGAKAVISGVPMICEALRVSQEKKNVKKPLLIIEASDTSENTHSRIRSKCEYYGVMHCIPGITGSELARATRKTGVVAAVAINDANLVAALGIKLQDEQKP